MPTFMTPSSKEYSDLQRERDRLQVQRDELLDACKAFLAKPDSAEAIDVNRDYTDTDAAIDKIRAAVANAEAK
jgi:hypothetical protein